MTVARRLVRERIDAACARAGRRPTDVRLLAVSKGVTVSTLRAALAAGLTELGENRVGDVAAKAAVLPGVRWELVGRLQSNKAARAVAMFHVVHSIDTSELAHRLDRLMSDAESRSPATRPLPVFLQVNVDGDPAKSGLSPSELESALPALCDLRGLELLGLMTIGRMVDAPEQARPTFAGLRELSDRLRGQYPMLGAGLSMGMTDDFEIAVEEGATVVRVGRAIFGPVMAR
ncbi:YggS family pyridoxal phosphate-dependent enzyme [soil metagenome]